MNLQKRRALGLLCVALAIVVYALQYQAVQLPQPVPAPLPSPTAIKPSEASVVNEPPALAREELEKLAVKGRAPKTGYVRAKFGDGWLLMGNCDTRNIILRRDLSGVVVGSGCKVMSGVLADPYTGSTVTFMRGTDTSDDVQIDHVVALSNAWQTGAQLLPPDRLIEFANDPLELLAVDGNANQAKGDGDAATWLPANKGFRCQYVARQIAVKVKYSLWVTAAEKSAMQHVLASCPEQRLPAASN
ncbi:MAG: HNH endonuclease family protein [Candidatus Saccharimonas sp.]